MVDHLDLQGRFGTILADPPWQFHHRTGKVAPEHRRLRRYRTMSLAEIAALPVADLAAAQSHLYLWCPNALLAEGLEVLRAWGFAYKSNIVWLKTRKDGGPDGRGVGFYFRNVTELLLFGVRGRLRTLAPGRTQVNLLATQKQEHSRKPDAAYRVIEACSPGPYLELFARTTPGLDLVGRRDRHLRRLPSLPPRHRTLGMCRAGAARAVARRTGVYSRSSRFSPSSPPSAGEGAGAAASGS